MSQIQKRSNPEEIVFSTIRSYKDLDYSIFKNYQRGSADWINDDIITCTSSLGYGKSRRDYICRHVDWKSLCNDCRKVNPNSIWLLWQSVEDSSLGATGCPRCGNKVIARSPFGKINRDGDIESWTGTCTNNHRFTIWND